MLLQKKIGPCVQLIEMKNGKSEIKCNKSANDIETALKWAEKIVTNKFERNMEPAELALLRNDYCFVGPSWQVHVFS